MSSSRKSTMSGYSSSAWASSVGRGVDFVISLLFLFLPRGVGKGSVLEACSSVHNRTGSPNVTMVESVTFVTLVSSAVRSWISSSGISGVSSRGAGL